MAKITLTATPVNTDSQNSTVNNLQDLSNKRPAQPNQFVAAEPGFLDNSNLSPEHLVGTFYVEFSQLADWAQGVQVSETFANTPNANDVALDWLWETQIPEELATFFDGLPLQYSTHEKLLYVSAIIRNVYLKTLPQGETPQKYFTLSLEDWLHVYRNDATLQVNVRQSLSNIHSEMNAIKTLLEKVAQVTTQDTPVIPHENILLISFNQLVAGNDKAFSERKNRLLALEASLVFKQLQDKQKAQYDCLQKMEENLAAINRREQEAFQKVIACQAATSASFAVASESWDHSTQLALESWQTAKHEKDAWLKELSQTFNDICETQAQMYAAKAMLLKTQGVSDQDWQAFLLRVGENPLTIPDVLAADVDAAQFRHAAFYSSNHPSSSYYRKDYNQALEDGVTYYQTQVAYALSDTDAKDKAEWQHVLNHRNQNPLAVFDLKNQYGDYQKTHAKVIELVLNPERDGQKYQAVFMSGDPTDITNWRFFKVVVSENPESSYAVMEEWTIGKSVVSQKTLPIATLQQNFSEATDVLEKILVVHPDLQALDNLAEEMLPKVLELQRLFSATKSENKTESFVRDVTSTAKDLAYWWQNHKDEASQVWLDAKEALEPFQNFTASSLDLSNASADIASRVQYYELLGSLIEGDIENLCQGVLGRNIRREEWQSYADDAQSFFEEKNSYSWPTKIPQETTLIFNNESPYFFSEDLAEMTHAYKTHRQQKDSEVIAGNPWVALAVENFHKPLPFTQDDLHNPNTGASRNSSRRLLVETVLNNRDGYKAVYIGGEKTAWESWVFVKVGTQTQTAIFQKRSATKVLDSEIYDLSYADRSYANQIAQLNAAFDHSNDLTNLRLAADNLFEKVSALYALFEEAQNSESPEDFEFEILAVTLELQNLANTQEDNWQTLAAQAQDELCYFREAEPSPLDQSAAANEYRSKLSRLEVMMTWLTTPKVTELCEEILGQTFRASHPGFSAQNISYAESLQTWWQQEGVVIFASVATSTLMMSPYLRFAQAFRMAATPATQTFSQATRLASSNLVNPRMVISLSAGLSTGQLLGSELGRYYSGRYYHTGIESFYEQHSGYKLIQTYATQWQQSFMMSTLILGAGGYLASRAPAWSQSHSAHLRVLGDTLTKLGGFAERAAIYLPVNGKTREIISEFGQELLENASGDFGHILALLNGIQPKTQAGVTGGKIEFDAIQKIIRITHEYNFGSNNHDQILEMLNNPERLSEIEEAGGLIDRQIQTQDDGTLTVTLIFANGYKQIETYKPSTVPQSYRKLVAASQDGSESTLLLSDLGVDFDADRGTGSLVLSPHHSIEDLLQGFQNMNLLIAEVEVNAIDPYVKVFIGEQQMVIFIEEASDLENFQEAHRDFKVWDHPAIHLQASETSTNSDSVPTAVQTLLNDPEVQRRLRYAKANDMEYQIYYDPTTGLRHFYSSDIGADNMHAPVLLALETIESGERADTVAETAMTSPYLSSPPSHWILEGEIHPQTVLDFEETQRLGYEVRKPATVEPSPYDVAGFMQGSHPTRVVLRLDDNDQPEYSVLNRGISPDHEPQVLYSDPNFQPQRLWQDTLALADDILIRANGRQIAAAANLGEASPAMVPEESFVHPDAPFTLQSLRDLVARGQEPHDTRRTFAEPDVTQGFLSTIHQNLLSQIETPRFIENGFGSEPQSLTAAARTGFLVCGIEPNQDLLEASQHHFDAMTDLSPEERQRIHILETPQSELSAHTVLWVSPESHQNFETLSQQVGDDGYLIVATENPGYAQRLNDDTPNDWRLLADFTSEDIGDNLFASAQNSGRGPQYILVWQKSTDQNFGSDETTDPDFDTDETTPPNGETVIALADVEQSAAQKRANDIAQTVIQHQDWRCFAELVEQAATGGTHSRYYLQALAEATHAISQDTESYQDMLTRAAFSLNGRIRLNENVRNFIYRYQENFALIGWAIGPDTLIYEPFVAAYCFGVEVLRIQAAAREGGQKVKSENEILTELGVGTRLRALVMPYFDIHAVGYAQQVLDQQSARALAYLVAGSANDPLYQRYLNFVFARINRNPDIYNDMGERLCRHLTHPREITPAMVAVLLPHQQAFAQWGYYVSETENRLVPAKELATQIAGGDYGLYFFMYEELQFTIQNELQQLGLTTVLDKIEYAEAIYKNQRTTYPYAGYQTAGTPDAPIGRGHFEPAFIGSGFPLDHPSRRYPNIDFSGFENTLSAEEFLRQALATDFAINSYSIEDGGMRELTHIAFQHSLHTDNMTTANDGDPDDNTKPGIRETIFPNLNKKERKKRDEEIATNSLPPAEAETNNRQLDPAVPQRYRLQNLRTERDVDFYPEQAQAPYHVIFAETDDESLEVAFYVVPDLSDKLILIETWQDLAREAHWQMTDANQHIARIVTYDEYLRRHSDEDN